MNVLPKDPLIALVGGWAGEINFWSVLLRIGLSALLSAFIGTERSNKRHSAGLRTFILTSLAGTAAMLADLWLWETRGTGIFLLSVGTVVSTTLIATNALYISSRNQIKGITTSAGLLLCCLLGVCIGAGFYILTLAGALAMGLCLTRLQALEIWLKDRSNHFEIHLELTGSQKLKDFIATMRELGLRIDDIETNPAYVNSGLSVYSIALSITRKELKKFKTHKEIIAALSTLDYVSHIEEI